MREQLASIKEQAEKLLMNTLSLEALEDIRVRFLGKKGMLTQVLRGMGALSAEERPIIGQIANEVREFIEKELTKKVEEAKNAARSARLTLESIDVTLPGKPTMLGHKHPLIKILDEMKEIFLGLGFEIAEGPEIELDYYNFEALNIPQDHPARDMQDSFYISSDVLLRTHTSPVQVRTMQKRKKDEVEKDVSSLPVKIIAPGKVYRRDDDATHSPMFQQVEGLLIDEKVTFTDLKGVLLAFARQMFGEDREIRLRPSFFPFTEPSAEVDISCVNCGGQGCRVCSHTGWLEILGAGMVHPKVLAMSGYDPEKVTGFAFGMGVERIAMLKYGIDDLRLFYENDVRFLNQF